MLFCDKPGYVDQNKRKGNDNPLFPVDTDTLRRAVTASANEKLMIKLSSAVDNRDAAAIDVKYHKVCWRDNVFHLLRKETRTEEKSDELVSEISANIEFLHIINIIH